MDRLLYELRFAARTLAKAPLVSTAAVISLALGIGVNLALFTITRAILTNPLPVTDPQTLVSLFTVDTSFGSVAVHSNHLPVSFRNYEDYRDSASSFDGLAAFTTFLVNLGTDDSKPEEVGAELVTGEFFDVLGVDAAVGRVLTPADDREGGGGSVAVLRHGFWRERFGGDPDIVGRTIRLNGSPFTVVGVAAEGFRGTILFVTPDVWVPVADRHTVTNGILKEHFFNRRASFFNVVGRLAPGVGSEQAEAEMVALAERLEESYPEVNKNRTATLVPLAETNLPTPWREQIRSTGAALGIVVGVILLIACANVANLLLTRASDRTRELATRVSLGASRRQLIRQLLVESLLLSGFGTAAGFALAAWLPAFLWRHRPPALLGAQADLSLDAPVILLGLALAIGTGLLFGLLPALRASRPDLVASLKDHTTRGRVRPGRLLPTTGFLSAGQVALAVVTLVGAGLALTSLQNSRRIEPGFEVDKLALESFNLGNLRYEPERANTFFRRLLDQSEAIPGVESAAVGTHIPISLNGFFMRSIFPEGQAAVDEGVVAVTTMVSPGYFDTLGIRLGEGRPFNEGDRVGSPPVAIVNPALARRLAAEGPVVGRRFTLSGTEGRFEVVGVTGDTKIVTLTETDQPALYLPLLQIYPNSETTLFLRTRADPGIVLGAAQAEIESLDPQLPVVRRWTFGTVVAQALWSTRLVATLLSLFAILAIVLTIVGLYAVISHTIRDTTREIGIRMALGADRLTVVGQVLRREIVPILFGLGVGFGVSLFLTPMAADLLYGVGPRDARILTGAIALLSVIAVIAILLPARAAARVHPMNAIRVD